MQIESWPLISTVLLSVILMVKIVWLKKQGMRPNRLNKHKSRSSILIGVVFFLISALWLFEVARPAFNIEFSLLPQPLTALLFQNKEVQLVGAVFILLGLILWAITLLHFGKSLRFGLDENNRGKLVTSGIFSFSRNPFFLSLDICFAGIALVLPNAFFLGFALIAVVSIQLFVLKEENFMQENYGEEYRHYLQKTRRYF